MNKELLIWTRDKLYGDLVRCREQTVSADQKLEWLMMAIADMCAALGRDSEDVPTKED